MRSTFILLALTAACGSNPPLTSETENEDFIPLAVGNRWTYNVTNSGIPSIKIQTVRSATTTAEGQAAFELFSEREDGKGTLSIQWVKDGQMWRALEETYREGVLNNRYVFEPNMLRLDSTQVTAGATYEDQHEKRRIDDTGAVLEIEEKDHRFVVEAGNEFVEVDAGTFSCIRVTRSRVGGTSKTYWYAPGVGKIKETGGQTEELAEYTLN